MKKKKFEDLTVEEAIGKWDYWNPITLDDIINSLKGILSQRRKSK